MSSKLIVDTIEDSTGTYSLALGSGNSTFPGGIHIGGTGSANLLDDYEEGTWTPAITLDSGSATLGAVSGSYTKIGNTVTVTFRIVISSTSSGAINNITGLPFTVKNVNDRAVGSVREMYNGGDQWHFRPNPNTTVGLVRRYDNSQTLANSDEFVGSVTYLTA